MVLAFVWLSNDDTTAVLILVFKREVHEAPNLLGVPGVKRFLFRQNDLCGLPRFQIVRSSSGISSQAFANVA
jgi:hypothetical protein